MRKALQSTIISLALVLSCVAPVAAATSSKAKVTPLTTIQKWLAQIQGTAGKVQTFTVTDLTSAIADADGQTPPDTRHGQCWKALLPIAQQNVSLGILPANPGLAGAIQKGFDIHAKLNAQLVPDSVITACSLTVYDLGTDFSKLMALVGVKVAAPALPALPGLAL